MLICALAVISIAFASQAENPWAAGNYMTLFIISGSAYLIALGIFHWLLPAGIVPKPQRGGDGFCSGVVYGLLHGVMLQGPRRYKHGNNGRDAARNEGWQRKKSSVKRYNHCLCQTIRKEKRKL